MARPIIRTLERIVSFPGTLDDLKKWWKMLAFLPLSVVQWWEEARAWIAGVIVSRAEWVVTVDMGLWWVGMIASILVLAMGWNTYKKYATASGVQGRPEIDASKPTRPLGKSFSEQYESHAHAGTVTFDYSNNDGKYRIGQGEQIFKIKWGGCSESAIYLYKDSGSPGTIAVTDKRAIGEIEDASVYNGSSNTRRPRVGEVAVLENAHGFWAAVRIINIEYKNRGSDHDELTFEYVIQTNGTPSFTGITPPDPDK